MTAGTVLSGLGGAAALSALGLLAWVGTSPMPVVRLLRRGGDAPAKLPAGYPERLERVRRIKDLTYPSREGKNWFDLYLPQKADGACPVILWIHGGAFVAGEKEGVEPWAVCLASEGVAVAAMDYQWAPEAAWPAQVIQVGDCCRCLREMAERYALDMTRLVLAGDSAGAHIAVQAALAQTSLAFTEASCLGPMLESGTLRGLLLYCGPYDVKLMGQPKDRKLRFFMSRVGWSYFGRRRWQDTLGARVSAVGDFVTEDFPPVYLTDGNAWSFEPQGRALVRILEEHGVPVSSRFFPKEEGEVPHEYQCALAQPNAQLCYTDTLTFLRRRGFLPQVNETMDNR